MSVFNLKSLACCSSSAGSSSREGGLPKPRRQSADFSPPADDKTVGKFFHHSKNCRDNNEAARWPTCDITLPDAIARSFADHTKTNEEFCTFMDGYMEARQTKRKAENCTQLLGQFFRFHVKRHAKAMAAKMAVDQKSVDALLADLCRLAFETVVERTDGTTTRFTLNSFLGRQPPSEAQFEISELVEKYPGICFIGENKQNVPFNVCSLGLIEVLPEKRNGRRFCRFSNRLIAEYLAALYLSSYVWYQIGENSLPQIGEHPADQAILHAKRIVDNCIPWKRTLEALPLTASVVKYFFGLVRSNITCYQKRKISDRSTLNVQTFLDSLIDEIVLQFYKNFHGHSLVYRYLEMSQTNNASEKTFFNRNVLETLHLVNNKRLPKRDLFSARDRPNWQLALIEAAYESGELAVAQNCLTEALFNESFYGSQSFKSKDKNQDKLYYTIICLTFLLQTGDSFCNLELSALEIDGTHLKLLAERVRGMKDLSLESLDLSKNRRLTDYEGDRYLGEFLCLCSRLSMLNLSDCGLTALSRIIDRSSFFMPLAHLDLSKNVIGDDDCRKLLETLKRCRGLTALLLNSNKLTKNCCSDIADFIKCCPIGMIDLSENNLTDEGAEKILSALAVTPYVTKIFLRSTGITPELFLPINEAANLSVYLKFKNIDKRRKPFTIVASDLLDNKPNSEDIKNRLKDAVGTWENNVKLVWSTADPAA